MHARTFGNVQENTSHSLPTDPPEVFVFECYELTLIHIPPPILDCPFTLELTELRDDDGHAHTPPHPMEDPAKVVLQYDGPDLDPSPLRIESSTEKKVVRIRYPLTEAAGVVRFVGIIDSPPGYVCASFCFTDTAWKSIWDVGVGVGGLSALPASGPHHMTVRGGTDTHPQGTHGTGSTIATLQKIARTYFERTGRKLSINDLSLPRGGLFDINNNWNPPHRTHRFGNDADINRIDGGGIIVDCEDELGPIVKDVARGRMLPKLRCESGDRRHIDF